MTKESDKFECVAQTILHNNCGQLGYDRIEGSKRYRGKSTKRKRQVDLTIHLKDGKIIPVECKLYKRKVGIKAIDGFRTVIYCEVGAEEGLVVSSQGFDLGAEAAAKAYNIEMATLNPAATEYDYNLKIVREHLGGINESFWGVSDICPVSDKSSLQSTPVERPGE